MTFHQKLSDDLYVSQETRKADGRSFLLKIAPAERLINAIMALISPELYSIGMDAIAQLKSGNQVAKQHTNVKLWPSVFSGLEVIANRRTPLHRDPRAAPPMYDFLLSAGTHSEAFISLVDIDAQFCYNPGTGVILCGKMLLHEVPGWEGGERVCIAHFI
jgi:hypothetical protein